MKKIILDGLVQHKIHDQECIVLKDWIYFYEVLARFGLLHWVGKPKRKRMCYEEPTSKLIHITADQLPLVILDLVTLSDSANSRTRRIFALSVIQERFSILSPPLLISSSPPKYHAVPHLSTKGK